MIKAASEIHVVMASPTEEGRLYPEYISSADLLQVSSKIPAPWSNGIDINGHIIFDIGDDNRLCNFDILIPKRRWIYAPAPFHHKFTQCADLYFAEDAITQKSLSIDLGFITNSERSELVIEIGTAKKPIFWYELSTKCFAAVDNDCSLVGFEIFL